MFSEVLLEFVCLKKLPRNNILQKVKNIFVIEKCEVLSIVIFDMFAILLNFDIFWFD